MTHHHDDHELAWALTGSIVIETRQARWHVDHEQALWIPAGTPHTIHRRRGALVFPIFFETDTPAPVLPEVTAITRSSELGNLVDACLQHVLARDHAPEPSSGELLEAITRHSHPRASLPVPQDTLVRTVATDLLADPSSNRTLTEWAALLHVSPKTLQRHFRTETGTTFSAWRRNARLMAAQTMLTDGDTVTVTAARAGFSSPSAFIRAYKRHFGHTPSRARP